MSIADLTGGPSYTSRPTVARGVVAKPPTALDQPMTVVLANLGNAQGFEVPAGQWMHRGDTLPLLGDQCVVLFDDDGDVWVPAWDTPSLTSAPGGGGSLDALMSGDKIIWQTEAGADVIELWGLLTPPGFAAVRVEDWDTNTTAEWNYASLLPSGTWNAGEQRIKVTNSDAYGNRADWGPFNDAARVSVDFTFVGGTNDSIAAAWFFDAVGTWTDQVLGFTVQTQGGGFYKIVAMHGDSFQRTDVVTNLVLVAGEQHRLAVTRAGNNLEWLLETADDETLVSSGSFAIPGPKQAQFGATVDLEGVGFRIYGASGLTSNLDNVTVYEQEEEARDLYMAVTPASGGTRTVRRIFGSVGPSTFRSDFDEVVESWREFGAAGQPAMANGFNNYGGPLAFYKDPNGTVHLSGEISKTSATSAAGLAIASAVPAGYRPRVRSYWSVPDHNAGTTRVIQMTTAGVLQVSDSHGSWPNPVYLNLGELVWRGDL